MIFCKVLTVITITFSWTWVGILLVWSNDWTDHDGYVADVSASQSKLKSNSAELHVRRIHPSDRPSDLSCIVIPVLRFVLILDDYHLFRSFGPSSRLVYSMEIALGFSHCCEHLCRLTHCLVPDLSAWYFSHFSELTFIPTYGKPSSCFFSVLFMLQVRLRLFFPFNFSLVSSVYSLVWRYFHHSRYSLDWNICAQDRIVHYHSLYFRLHQKVGEVWIRARGRIVDRFLLFPSILVIPFQSPISPWFSYFSGFIQSTFLHTI